MGDLAYHLKMMDYYNEQITSNGIKEGKQHMKEQGLAALVDTLDKLLPSFDAVYEAVVKNEIYADVTKETVGKYYYNSYLKERLIGLCNAGKIFEEQRMSRKEENIKDLITGLKKYFSSFEELCEAVRSEGLYADLTDEQIRKYL